MEKFIRGYLIDKFDLLSKTLELSLSCGHGFCVASIIAFRDGLGELGAWESFYQKNKQNVDDISKNSWVKDYWNGTQVEEGKKKFYLREKKSLKNDLTLLLDILNHCK